MDREWAQFLFVAVPVLSLIGSWLALRGRRGRRADDTTNDRVDEHE